MMLITGPLWSGKRAFACRALGCTREELSARAVWDAQYGMPRIWRRAVKT